LTESRRVLYVGTLHPGSTALHRMAALEDLGLTVTPFDTYPYLIAGTRLARSMRHRSARGTVVARLNRAVTAAAHTEEYDWIWIDKGVWLSYETLTSIARPGRQLLHYAGDPMLLFHRTSQFVSAIPAYDVLITTKSYEIEGYRHLGGRRIICLLHGYDARLYRPKVVDPEKRSILNSDVCFVGHFEPHYRGRVLAASHTGADVAVWGQWQRAARMSHRLREIVRGPGVWGEDYVDALNSTKIGLGLLTRLAPDSSTTRSFEIPACGTFLLAERSAEHIKLFEEGREAEFFDSGGEMQEKIDWYLTHESERRQIAAAGRARCVRAGYSYLERMRAAIAMID
jgi:spore maturation protein CgeB